MAVGRRSVTKGLIIIPSNCLHTELWMLNAAPLRVPAVPWSQAGQTRESLQEKGLDPGNAWPGLHHPWQHLSSMGMVPLEHLCLL